MNLFKKIKSAFIILKHSGINGFADAVLNLIAPNKNGERGYKQYDLEWSPLRPIDIFSFIAKCDPTDEDIIVVPTIFKEKIASKYFFTKVIDTLTPIGSHDLDKANRLIWATERVDRNVVIASHFYSSKKKVMVMNKGGPARNWMHDQVKELVLKEEFRRQSIEGIEKFSYGIGSDFGNLLQIVDNAKSIKGDFVEIGCFMGSSTCVMANYMQKEGVDKTLFVYDYFDGFSYEEAKNSVDDSWVDTHKTDGLLAVQGRIHKRLDDPSRVKVFKRNIIDSDALNEVSEIAFANIDVDMYEAVYAALRHVHKKLSVHGIIVVEDAGHTPNLLGATIALNQFLEFVGRSTYLIFQMESGQYILIKKT